MEKLAKPEENLPSDISPKEIEEWLTDVKQSQAVRMIQSLKLASEIRDRDGGMRVSEEHPIEFVKTSVAGNRSEGKTERKSHLGVRRWIRKKNGKRTIYLIRSGDPQLEKEILALLTKSPMWSHHRDTSIRLADFVPIWFPIECQIQFRA